MPIAAVFEFPGQDLAQYRKVFEAGGSPIIDQAQRLFHVCYSDGDGFTVVDVWEDEGAFAAFGEIIGPATAAAGLDARPKVFVVAGMITHDGRYSAYGPA